jgi:hypothetical protein
MSHPNSTPLPGQAEKNYNNLFLLMIFILRHFNNGNSHAGTEFA